MGRILKRTEAGFTCEADPKHVDVIVSKVGLRPDSKGVVSPAVRDVDGDGEEELSRPDARLFREVTARANYLACDRPETSLLPSTLYVAPWRSQQWEGGAGSNSWHVI